VQGRWISPDPAGLGAVNMENPQTWNRYAYVENGPLNAVDPLGLHDPNELASYNHDLGECLVCIPIYINYGQIIMGNTFLTP